MKVYNLACEDASHLGGMMGTEYTTHMFSRLFTTLEKAQKYAESYGSGFPEWASWEQDKKHYWCDSGAFIWTITPQDVE